MSKDIVPEPVFLAIDIETCGINKCIFAIGCVLFKRNLPNDSNINIELIECIDEQIFAFSPKKPNIQEKSDIEQLEILNYNDFTIDTWDNFWSINNDILDILSSKSKFSNEIEILVSFYDYWTKITMKYHNIKLVSDNVAFDIGYIDNRISLLYDKLDIDKTKSRRPLNYQFRKKKWYYVSPLDTNTLECVIKLGNNGKLYLEKMLEECPFTNNHDPISDCKRIAWVFSRIMGYLTL